MKRIIALLILMLPFSVKAVTMDEYREALARTSESAAGTYGGEWVYSYFWGGTKDNPQNLKSSTTNVWRDRAKKGQKSTGYIYGFKPDPGIQGRFTDKFAVYCESFVEVMVHHASNGAVSYSKDYEKVKLSEMKRGDLIHFENHIAVYLGPGDSPKTYKVAHASGKIYIKDETRTPDYAWRLKESSLSLLDYNYVTSSYDFHDRLDDYAPIIKSVSLIPNSNKVKIEATDYKHYDLNPPSDIVEPENNGIIGYQLTTTNVKPATFKSVNKTQALDITEEVSKSGTYYVWVKDVGGNIASYTANLTNVVVDNIKPKVGTLNSTILRGSILVTIVGASDEAGIKEYRYYLNNKLVETSTDNEYIFENLSENKTYEIYYEVVDNNSNVSKSTIYNLETGVTAKNIILSTNNIELSVNETYRINARIEAENNNYTVKYKSSNPSVAIVSNDGIITATSSGTAIITISVGKKEASLSVKVLKYNIIFLNNDLPVSYVDQDYEVLIRTSPNSTITLYNGTLPNGLRIENNAIKGKPTNVALGKYNFSLIANVEGETKVKEYTIYVNKNNNINYWWLLLIVPFGFLALLVVGKIKKNNTYV